MRAHLRTIALASGLTLALPLLASPTGAVPPPWETVASGLDNPRQLSFTGETLYVAEAGEGGDGPCIEGAEGTACYGTTGAITRVHEGSQGRVLTGLPSLALEGGFNAIGPTDVDVTGKKRYAVTVGLGNDPEVRASLPALGQRLMGTVVTGAFPSSGPRVTADLGDHETLEDPDGAGPDTNPTGMIGSPSAYVVTDSGANALVGVAADGRTTTLAVFGSPGTAPVPFPPFEIPMQAVPTSVAQGPDGAFYVSELTGFPFVPGAARIHRVTASGQSSVWATGLTNVTDLAWYGGDLYAVQLSDVGLMNESGLPMGSLVKVTPGAPLETVAGSLPAPYGLALHDGAAYVTTCAVCADTGTVIRVPLG